MKNEYALHAEMYSVNIIIVPRRANFLTKIHDVISCRSRSRSYSGICRYMYFGCFLQQPIGHTSKKKKLFIYNNNVSNSRAIGFYCLILNNPFQTGKQKLSEPSLMLFKSFMLVILVLYLSALFNLCSALVFLTLRLILHFFFIFRIIKVFT